MFVTLSRCKYTNKFEKTNIFIKKTKKLAPDHQLS